jgi:hypothetical protein
VGGEKRSRRQLTPMSGELRSDEGWVPSDPVAGRRRRRRRKEKTPPVTRGQVLLAGLRRIAIVLGVVSVLIVGVALLIVQFSDVEPARAFPLAFFAGGALIGIGGFFSGTSGPSQDWMPEGGYDYEDRRRGVNTSLVYGSFGIVLIAIGAVLDSKL